MQKSLMGVQVVGEPVSISLGILASVLSIAASIKQFMAQGKSESDAFETYLSGANWRERKLLKDEGIQNAIHDALIISPKLLKQLSKEAQECEDRHIKARAEADSQIDKDNADAKARECICNVLRAIIRFNRMELPPTFKSMWESYGCTR